MQTVELPRVNGRHRNKALAQERRTKAVELAVGGHSYQAVADIMGYANRGTVYRIVQAALKARQVSSIDEVRALEASRLDALQAVMWKDAMMGNIQSAQTVLKIMDQRARLLGLHPCGGPLVGSETPPRTSSVVKARSKFDFASMAYVPM